MRRLIIIIVCLMALGALSTAIWLHGRHESEKVSTCDIFDNAKAGPLVANATNKFSSSSVLAEIPTSVEIEPTVVVSGAAIHSNGVVFNPPWRNAAVERTSTPNASWTFFNFGQDRIIETFASGTSLSPIADEAEQAFLTGLDKESPGAAELLSTCYWSIFNSNFSFIRASLYSSPADLATSTLSGMVLAATAFLPVKSVLIQSLTMDVLPIQHLVAIDFVQTSSVRGFGFNGWFMDETTTYEVAHFIVFGSDDRSRDILIEGATPAELGAFLSSVRIDSM